MKAEVITWQFDKIKICFSLFLKNLTLDFCPLFGTKSPRFVSKWRSRTYKNFIYIQESCIYPIFGMFHFESTFISKINFNKIIISSINDLSCFINNE